MQGTCSFHAQHSSMAECIFLLNYPNVFKMSEHLFIYRHKCLSWTDARLRPMKLPFCLGLNHKKMLKYLLINQLTVKKQSCCENESVLCHILLTTIRNNLICLVFKKINRDKKLNKQWLKENGACFLGKKFCPFPVPVELLCATY